MSLSKTKKRLQLDAQKIKLENDRLCIGIAMFHTNFCKLNMGNLAVNANIVSWKAPKRLAAETFAQYSTIQCTCRAPVHHMN